MASEIAIAASGNRLPNSCDLYEAGILVYGQMYNILFLDLRTNPPLILDDKCIMTAHRAKIVALSIFKGDKGENQELMVSAADDTSITIWDLNSKTSIANTEIRDCNALSWFPSNTLVVIASEHSNIVKWSYKQGTTKRIRSGCNQSILFIAHNPTNNEIIATGHRFGTITVMNVKTENLLHKLKVHSLDITSLSWSSVSPDVLLSTSLDMSARVWKLGEVQPIHSFYVPNSRKMEDKKQTKFFGIFYPGSENRIICVSRGELGTVTFKEKEKPEFKNFWLKAPECPNRGVYNLYTWKHDAEDVKRNILCTIDPYKISLFDLEDMKCTLSLVANHTAINKMVVSPINPNLVAICCGDSSVKLWNQSSENYISSVFINSRMKIFCGSFHPIEAHLFAFGTDEGRIGIIDVNKRKFLYSYETHHRSAAYSVCWAPCSKALSPEGKSTKDLFLYSCGGGAIYVHKLNEPKSPALNFDEIIDLPPEMSDCRLHHSDLSWRQDYSCLAVASYKGFTDLYDGQLSLLGRLITPASAIECLCWHPDSTYSSPDSSPLKMWLACGGKFLDIHIFDTAEVIEKGEKVMMRATRKLTGHTKSIMSMNWSIHSDGYLASGSRDGTAQIWNAVRGTCIANYPGHRDYVTSVLWNIENPDVMMTSGQDGLLRLWRISEQTTTSPPPAGKSVLVKKPKLKYAPKISNVEENSVTETAPKQSNRETIGEEIQKKKSSETEGDAASNKKDTGVQEKKLDDTDMNKKGGRKPFYGKRTVPVYPHFSHDHGVEGIEDCKRLVDLYYSDANDDGSSFEELRARLPAADDDALKFGLFADQLAALSMMEAQSNQYKKDNLRESYEYLQVHMLNVRNLIDEACKNGKLTDFLISLAPVVSHKYWLEVCEKYALQLIQEENYRRGSLYLLMCGKLYEAINVLAEKGYVYEALALAKVHLPESDPAIEKLLRYCASKFRMLKLFTFEAQCSIALKDPLSGSRILCGIPDPNGARIAVYVCRKSGLEAEAANCAFLCLDKCLAQLDWATAKRLTQEEESMKPYSMLVHVHEIIYAHIRHLKKENGVLVKEMLCSDSADSVPFWKGQTCKDSNQTLISYIYSSLRKQSLLTEDEQFLKNTHEALNLMLNYRKSSDVASEAHISIALYLAQYVVLALKEDFELATKYFLKIFEVSCNVVFLPKIVSMLLLPIELQWSKKTNSVIWEGKKNAADSACPIIHFYGLYSSLGQLITDWELDEDNTTVISAGSLSNLQPLVGTIRKILSTKTIFDLLAAYFSVSFLNDLESLVSKQKLRPECRPSKSPEENKSVPVQDNIRDEDSSNARESDIRNELADNRDIEKLIELALKEANEKAEQLQGVEKDVQITEENSENEVCSEPVQNSLNDQGSKICKELKENNLGEKVTEEEHSAKNECANFNSEAVNHSAISTNGVCGATSPTLNVQESQPIYLKLEGNKEADVSEGYEDKLVGNSPRNGGDSREVENISCASEEKNNEKYMCSNSTSSSKEENVANDVVENVLKLNNAENDMKLEEMSDASTTTPFSQTQKVEGGHVLQEVAMSHELCLNEIGTFCSVVKLMCNVVCRDEFALFYYLQDLVKYINQEITSTLKIAPRVEEKTKSQSENGPQKKVCESAAISPEQKQAEFISISGIQDGDLGNGTDSFDSLNSSGGLKKDGRIKECDSEVKLEEKGSLNSMDDSQIFYDCNDKDIEPPPLLSTPSNELRNEKVKEMNGSESLENIEDGRSQLRTVDVTDSTESKLDEPECVPVANRQMTVAEQEKEKLQMNSECEVVPEEKVDEKNVADFNHSSSSPKNAKYQEEKKQILELITVLESEYKDKPYPNPFVAASKAVQACNDIFRKSGCPLVRERVHGLAHQVLAWVQKFAIDRKPPPLSCDLCKSV